MARLPKFSIPNDLGMKLRTQRMARELTLDQVAALCDTTKGYVCELENRRRNPGAAKVAALASALGVTTDYLLFPGQPLEEAIDKAFYREYLNASAYTKTMTRKLFLSMQEP